ncbi:MAG: protein kinase [Luteolibacter sp.]
MDPTSRDASQSPPSPLGGLDPADLLRQGATCDTFAGPGGATFNPPPLEELAAFFPQLEILELIGKGGMGAVYKVRQKALDRSVALKILPPGMGATPEFSDRFSREAKTLAKLNHPNIVTLHEFGQTGDLPFILMEFVDGMNLAQLLKTGRVSPREALAIVPQICDALQFAHDHGIVHRDIKPENILLDRQGRVKVADFGIAKMIETTLEPLADSTGTLSNATLAGKIIGTPDYMAPEQLEHPQTVDHRADIYALGVVFYQMLTGELPKANLTPPSKKAQIDLRLDEVVLRALEKEPALRYQQAETLKTRIETLSTVPNEPTKKITPSFNFTKAIFWLLLVILLIPIAAIGISHLATLHLRKSIEAKARQQTEHRLAKSSDSLLTSNPRIPELMEITRSKGTSAAIDRFLQIDWNLDSLFPPDSPSSLNEEAFTDLTNGERGRKSPEIQAHLGFLRSFLAEVEQTGNQSAMQGDFTKASQYFESLRSFGQSLSRPNRLLLFRLLGQATKNKAEAKLASFSKPSTAKSEIKLLVQSESTYRIGGETIDAAHLQERLEKIAAFPGRLSVTIAADSKMPNAYPAIMHAADACGNAGIWDLQYRSEKFEIEFPAGLNPENWLGQLDRSEYAQAWKESSPFVHRVIAFETWQAAIRSARQPLGAMKSRVLKSVTEAKSLPGVPDGDYRVLQFDTSFTNKENALETLTFSKEKDETWKACGYYIR